MATKLLRYRFDCTHKRCPQPGAPSEIGNVDIDLITHKRFPQLVVTSKIGNVVIDLISLTQGIRKILCQFEEQVGSVSRGFLRF